MKYFHTRYLKKLKDSQEDPGKRVLNAMVEVMVEHDTTLPINFIRRWWLRRKREYLIKVLNQMKDLDMLY